jgi:DNA polymerase-3 subunit gamma/tau
MSGLFPQESSPAPAEPAGPGLFGDAPATAALPAAYRVLARKYRPTRFADLIGQGAMVRTLRNAFALGRIAHAFMLTGVRGVGKTTTARIIARALNCTGPDGKGGPTADPCGACPDCVAILADRHPDVIEMDAASRTGVDDVREIVEATRFRPLQARTKVFVIDEVHMLSRNAFNALLKTLEEPPPHVKFVFATTDPRKVPVTVLSRCQRFDLRRVAAAELVRHFQWICGPERESVAVAPEALALIARAADGSVRDGLSLLDQAIAQAGPGAPVTASTVLDMLGLADRAAIFDLTRALLHGNIAQALTTFDQTMDAGADPATVTQDLLDFVHTITRVKTLPALEQNADLSEQEFQAAKHLADRLSVPTLGRAWQMLLKGVGEVESAPDRRAAADMVLIRLCYVADQPTPGELVQRLTGSEAGSGTPSSDPVPLHDGAQASLPDQVGKAWSEGAANAGNLALAPAASPSAEPEPAPAETGPKLENFRDVARLVAEQREATLHAHLVHSVHLVRFAPPVIELRPEPDAPRDVAARLAALLQQATATRWTIAVSPEAGEPTLAEQGRAADAARRGAAADHPLVRAILDAFPGARIDRVRDATLDAYGLPPETGALTDPASPALAPDADNPDWEQQA